MIQRIFQALFGSNLSIYLLWGCNIRFFQFGIDLVLQTMFVVSFDLCLVSLNQPTGTYTLRLRPEEPSSQLELQPL